MKLEKIPDGPEPLALGSTSEIDKGGIILPFSKLDTFPKIFCFQTVSFQF
jgi:hypothetical protein